MVDFGVIGFPTDQSITPLELGPELEQRGYESVFYAEHTHIPTSRRSPFIGGGDLPEMYWRSHDQFVALAMVASVTATLTLGTGITLVTEHDPINLAKRVASLDALSGGRVIFGIGAGWNAEEMEDHGVAFADRWKVTRERVLSMWSWPKPSKRSGPPILMGAYSKWVPKRIAEYCDGWMPIDGAGDVEGSLREIRNALKDAGRAADSFDITLLAAASPERGPDLSRIEDYVELGVNRVLLPIPNENRDGTLKVLDTYTDALERLS
jgi:alkanesulfonate monooxygenase SsuD/methylene tetrahydromethanopterin reductase-like flavin-dependent oxidoreductase (luciferase family)